MTSLLDKAVDFLASVTPPWRSGSPPPSLDVLHRQMVYAAARMGRYYGRKRAHESLVKIASSLSNGSDPMSITIDVQHMEEML